MGGGRLVGCGCTVGPGWTKGPGVPGAGILGPAGALVAWKDPVLPGAFPAHRADSFKGHHCVAGSLQRFSVEFRCGFHATAAESELTRRDLLAFF